MSDVVADQTKRADIALVEAAAAVSRWLKDVRSDWLADIERYGSLTPNKRQIAQNIVNLNRALEASDMRVLVSDYCPEAGVMPSRQKQRVVAVWRGGSNRNVLLEPHGMYDFKTGEWLGAWAFLIDVVGLSSDEAATELIYRAGLSHARPNHQPQQVTVTKFNEVSRELSEEDKERESLLAEYLKTAERLHRLGKREGISGYFGNKGTEGALQSHTVAGSVIYAHDALDSFVQLSVINFGGEAIGYQRIYDSACIKRKRDKSPRDKDFIGDTKGGFIALVPKEIGTLPETAKALGKWLRKGYTLSLCEGVATGMSVCLANPKTIVLCVLYARNFMPVLAGFRAHYGVYGGRAHPFAKRTALAPILWADNDQWRKDPLTKERLSVKKGEDERNDGLIFAQEAAATHAPVEVVWPTFKEENHAYTPTDFNDLHLLEGFRELEL